MSFGTTLRAYRLGSEKLAAITLLFVIVTLIAAIAARPVYEVMK